MTPTPEVITQGDQDPTADIPDVQAAPETETGPLRANGRGGWSCRAGCGACCIALSISSPIPGMPDGKPAGVRCVQLDEQLRCRIFGQPERPEVCGRLRPMPDLCGQSRAEAMALIAAMEAATQA